MNEKGNLPMTDYQLRQIVCKCHNGDFNQAEKGLEDYLKRDISKHPVTRYEAANYFSYKDRSSFDYWNDMPRCSSS